MHQICTAVMMHHYLSTNAALHIPRTVPYNHLDIVRIFIHDRQKHWIAFLAVEALTILWFKECRNAVNKHKASDALHVTLGILPSCPRFLFRKRASSHTRASTYIQSYIRVVMMMITIIILHMVYDMYVILTIKTYWDCVWQAHVTDFPRCAWWDHSCGCCLWSCSCSCLCHPCLHHLCEPCNRLCHA